VLCGDFNFAPYDAQYRALFAPPLADAWNVLFPDKPHPHTTGLHDRAQWPIGGHCRDYFAVTADVAKRVRSIEMDAASDASDHQPLRLTLK
jgi:endonuclease/exonuclease/phosphatase family metal-dependent hydrolase